ELLERKLIADPKDIFFLKASNLAQLPLFKDKSIQNLLDTIQTARDKPINQLLYGFDIRHVGASAAQRLADAFGSVDAIVNAPVEELAAVDGVGDVIGRAVREYFDRPKTVELLDKLRRAGVRMSETRVARTGPLTGKTFVITGTLGSFSREVAKEK